MQTAIAVDGFTLSGFQKPTLIGCLCTAKTATTSLAPASRGCDAGPLPPAALVVPGHRTPSGCLALRVTGRHPGRLPPSRRHQLGEGEARSRQVLGHPNPPRVSGDVPLAREQNSPNGFSHVYSKFNAEVVQFVARDLSAPVNGLTEVPRIFHRNDYFIQVARI